MSVYVFYAVSRKRARIHAGACSHCREGRGRDLLKERANISGWSPKLGSVREAREYIRKRFPNFLDVATCAVCDPA
jgi:hypothetical protein